MRDLSRPGVPVHAIPAASRVRGGASGKKPTKAMRVCLVHGLVACMGRSAIGPAAAAAGLRGLALSPSLAAFPAFVGLRLAMARAAVAAGLGGTLLLLATRSICRAVYSVVCSEWV